MVKETSGECPICTEKYRLYRDLTTDFKQWFDCLVLLILLALLPLPLIPLDILDILRIIELRSYNQTRPSTELL